MTSIRAIAAVIIVLAAGIPGASAQSPTTSREYRELASRLEAQEAELRALRQRVEDDALTRTTQFAGLRSDKSCDSPKDHLRRLPVVVEQTVCDCGARQDGGPQHFRLRYFSDYDDGFVIRPFNRQTHPFELKINGWIQFRHVGFAQDVQTWTDNAGVTRPVLDRNKFDVERARLVFSGFALTPDLTYFLQLDGDTEGRETVDFFDYWWGYRFSEGLQLQVGKRKVPGSRQWLLVARSTRFVDRPMANDFFRPDRTVGVFAVGDVGQTFHYEAMVGNGIRTSNLGSADIDDKFAFAGTAYWDPLRDFGGQLVDFDGSERPLVRVGSSFAYGPQSGLVDGIPLGESDFVRFADGTRLTAPGALAAGVTVSEFDVYLLSVDAAAKWRGWSVNAEAFFRWLQNIAGNGALPDDQLFQRGFYVEGGTFLIPRKLDVNVRYSQIDGLFGNAAEFAAGFNWYPTDTPRMKVSFDVSDIKTSPLNNTTSEILVGDDGTLFRTQFQVEF